MFFLLDAGVGLSEASKRGGIGGREKGDVRVNAGTERGFAFFAVAAATVGYIERHHNSVSLFEQGDSGARFEDYAHVFVACSY